jgi:hypothetical protein
MAKSKLEKSLYGPSLVEVILGALLGLLLGVVAACVFLVFKPVTLLKEKPKEYLRSVVYYMPGAESNAKSRAWQAKQKQFLAGTTVHVVEEELNAWGASIAQPVVMAKAKPAAPAKPGAAPAKPDAPVPEGFVIPSTPNFRFVDGKLQIAMKCTLNWYGMMTDVTIQATGAFRRDSEGYVFAPDTVYLGSCPVHLLPGAASPLVSYLITHEKAPDEMRAAWNKLGSVAIEGTTLKLAVQ